MCAQEHCCPDGGGKPHGSRRRTAHIFASDSFPNLPEVEAALLHLQPSVPEEPGSAKSAASSCPDEGHWDSHPSLSWIGEPHRKGSARCVLIHRESAGAHLCVRSAG